MSKDKVRSYHQRQGCRAHPEGQGGATNTASVQVPWEKEVSKEELLGLGLRLGQGKDSGSAAGRDLDLLEEIDSIFCFNSGLNSSPPLPQAHRTHNSHHQVQGRAADK